MVLSSIHILQTEQENLLWMIRCIGIEQYLDLNGPSHAYVVVF